MNVTSAGELIVVGRFWEEDRSTTQRGGSVSEPVEYAEGGYIGGGEVPAFIHPEECLLKREGDGWRCVRPDHNHGDDK